jgi:tetratricopeptide (TPR) repeat protein
MSQCEIDPSRRNPLSTKILVKVSLSSSPNDGRRAGPPVNDAVRESLRAVQAARDLERRRTRRARGMAAAAVGFAAAVIAGAALFARSGEATPRPPAPAAEAPPSPVLAPIATAAPRAAPVAAPPGPAARAPAPAGPEAAPAPTAEAAPPPAPAAAAPAAAAEPSARPRRVRAPVAESPPDSPETLACVEAFDQRRWLAVIDACAAAFASSPHPALALRVAHAHHARGRFAKAGLWAERTLALDDTRPEAFIILAHAAERAGRAAEAARCYERYLALAPRGWHADHARAALAEAGAGESQPKL